MIKKYAVLQKIENNHTITKEHDFVFLHHFQKGLLLALKEKGILTSIQYRLAEDKLNQQRRNWYRRLKQQENYAVD